MVTPSRRLAALTLAALVVVAVAACSSGGATGSGGASSPSAVAPPSQGDRPSPSNQQVPIASPSGGQEGAVPDEILQQAIADAAQTAGVDPSQVTVVSTEAVVWNNGALGCPKPGEMYTQALVPGYKIVLEAGGRQLDYHASDSGTVKLCEGPFGS
jgi:hypothetical protein